MQWRIDGVLGSLKEPAFESLRRLNNENNFFFFVPWMKEGLGSSIPFHNRNKIIWCIAGSDSWNTVSVHMWVEVLKTSNYFGQHASTTATSNILFDLNFALQQISHSIKLSNSTCLNAISGIPIHRKRIDPELFGGRSKMLPTGNDIPLAIYLAC